MKTFYFKMVGLWVILASSLSLSISFAFAAEYKPEILTEIQNKVKEALEEGRRPVVIFDLDDTLINTRDRNLRILKNFIAQQDIQNRFPNETALVRDIQLSNLKYLLNDTLKSIGVTNENFLKEANAFWLERFFTNEYCKDDLPMVGAVNYVQWLYEAGATIVYLTGRDEPRMGEGTRANLRVKNFPLSDPEDNILMMKPNKDMDDLAFKVGAFDTIATLGDVVAAFENEPANINALQKRFPDGRMVFVDTIHSPKPDVPAGGIFWIRDFSSERKLSFVGMDAMDVVLHPYASKGILDPLVVKLLNHKDFKRDVARLLFEVGKSAQDKSIQDQDLLIGAELQVGSEVGVQGNFVLFLVPLDIEGESFARVDGFIQSGSEIVESHFSIEDHP